MKQHFLRGAGALMASLVLVLGLTLAAAATDTPGEPASPSQSQGQEGSPSPTVPATETPSPSPAETPASLKALEILSTGGSMEVGSTKELTLITDPDKFDLSSSTVTWKIEKGEGVIEVNGGIVTAKAPGDAEVTATVGNVTSRPYAISVSGVVLSTEKENDKTLLMGKTTTLKVSLYGGAIGLTTPDWVSSDPKVASVVTGGKVTGRAPGKATITVTYYDGKNRYTNSIDIEVKENTLGLWEGGSVTAGSPYRFSGILSNLNQVCRTALENTNLVYISNLAVSPRQGVLYYGYKSPADTGSGVGGTEKYYYTRTTGQRSLSDVTFVPKSEFSGTAEITYTGFGSNGEFYTGTIRLTIKAIDDVSYTTLKDAPVVFQGGDFNTICRVRTGHELSYVTFTLPAASQGVLYYNYNGEPAYAEKVIDGTQYFRTRSPYIDSITFVPASGFTGNVRIDYRGVDTAGLAYNGRVTINVGTGTGGIHSPEEGDVTYRAAAGDPVDFRASDFNDACWDVLNESLDYVRFSETSSSQGELRYNYRSSSSTGSQVSESTRYYRSGSPSISNITFVPASSGAEAVTLSFVGYGASSGGRFEGTVVIDYTGRAAGGSIQYTVRAGRPAEFETADFNELCQNKLGSSLDYVRFDDLPSSSRGTLYRNYSSSGSGTRVDEDDRITRTSLSRVAFVPNRSYSGAVDIGFTGYDTNGNTFSGTVTILVDESGASQGIRYSTRPGGSVLFNASDFNDACREATGASLNYVRFELPASSRGDLYYKYDSDKPTEVKENTSYYRSGSGRLLDDVTFVANSNFSGTVEISYTGYSSGSGQFSGSVLITVAAPRAETIYLTAGSSPVRLSSASFRQACGTVLTQGLTYVRFTSLPDTNAGRLYENYVDAASGYQASTGSPYYLSGSPGIDQLTFVPQPGYQGTAVISYTGYGAGGDQVSGTVEISVSNGGGSVTIPTGSSFSDMAGYSWASEAVEYLSQTGVVNGIGSGRFGPEQTIQRCDFTLMLCRGFRFNMVGGNSFPDIPAGSYYGSAVTTAKSLGIVTGSNGLFMPTSALSRQDAMLMLKRAMVAAGWSVPSGAEGSLSRFSDGAQVSGYARDAVASMVQMGVVTGDGANRLKPWEPISRAEMAVILYRVLAR